MTPLRDVTRHLAPGLKLYITPSGWYTLEWDLPPGVKPNLGLAIRNLETMIEHGNLPPATEPQQYAEDSYQTAGDVLADLKRYVKFLAGEYDLQATAKSLFGILPPDADLP